ncbi:MAG: hypothetical protein JWM74_4160 [Myxococcaceae bacterium]|nr:hypothetical protein [Myxococcaceae bacterium]
MKAKFRCRSVSNYQHGEIVTLHPSSCDDVNAAWSATKNPSGILEMRIERDEARAQFKPGAEYIVDVTPVEVT